MKGILLFLIVLPFTTCTRFEVAPKEISDRHRELCAKIDTLIQERYFLKPKYDKYADRITSEMIRETKIDASWQFGFAGKHYCDSSFNDDIRRWCKYLHYTVSLPKARFTHWCDTSLLTLD